MFLHFLGHPRLLGTLNAVRHEISRPKTFANGFYVLGEVKNVQGRSGGKLIKYRGFKVRGPPCPLRVEMLNFDYRCPRKLQTFNFFTETVIIDKLINR